MKALAILAWGLILVMVDFRINGVDLIPDPIGWAVALIAFSTLRHQHVGHVVAAVASVVALPFSVLTWFGRGDAVLSFVEGAAVVVVVVATCTAIAATVPPASHTARQVRAWFVGLTIAVLALATLAVSSDDVVAFAALAIALGLALLGVTVWYLVLLFRTSRQPAPA